MKKLISVFAVSLFTLLVFSKMAYAHSGSTSFIELEISEGKAQGAWWLSLKDLQVAVGIDTNLDDQISFGEFKQQSAFIEAYIQKHLLAMAGSEACLIDWQTLALSRLDDGVYVQAPLIIQCAKPTALSELKYTALFDYDISHRAIVKISQGDDKRVLLFSPDQQQQQWDFTQSNVWQSIVTYIEQGIIHILEGYDHLLFLMALLVPIVFAKKTDISRQTAVTSFRRLSTDLLKVITAFTAGHSITLILATVFSISPPSSWVESLIAISVVIAGINIVIPLFRESSWRVAALFGLIHGFGFASVLAELSLDRETLAISLLSFNIGVEIGQLLVVLLVTPVLLLLARSSFHVPKLARYSAASTAVIIGTLWVVDRLPF